MLLLLLLLWPTLIVRLLLAHVLAHDGAVGLVAERATHPGD
jgi:hypothetical protein